MLFSPIYRRYLKKIRYFARFVHANACTQMHYLGLIQGIRKDFGRNEVILDADNCIVVL